MLNGSVGLSTGGNVVCSLPVGNTVSESVPKCKGRDLLLLLWSLNEGVQLGGRILGLVVREVWCSLALCLYLI